MKNCTHFIQLYKFFFSFLISTHDVDIIIANGSKHLQQHGKTALWFMNQMKIFILVYSL